MNAPGPGLTNDSKEKDEIKMAQKVNPDNTPLLRMKELRKQHLLADRGEQYVIISKDKMRGFLSSVCVLPKEPPWYTLLHHCVCSCPERRLSDSLLLLLMVVLTIMMMVTTICCC